MLKTRVYTPVVDVTDNMENAQTLNVRGLASGKARIGLLDNTKPNAALLLKSIGERLTERGLAEATYQADKRDSPTSNPASHGATEAVFAQLTQRSDLVLTGLGN